jgi:sulfatase maturation enzyme AslB (radical SAM superfamily)
MPEVAKHDRVTPRMKVRFGPSGVHLSYPRSGLNILLDEVVPPEALWTRTPRHVSIALTNACDLACSYCFAPKAPATLPFDRVTGWLSELDVAGTIGVGFGGGEPTLYPRFVATCAYAATKTNLSVSFTTHGHHLKQPLLDELQGLVNFVRVSIDGVGATYERLRQRPFRDLQGALPRLRRISRFGINYVVNADTLADLDEAVAFAEDAGASELLLLPQRTTDGRPAIRHSDAIQLRVWAQRYAGRVPLTISESAADGVLTCDPFSTETGLRAYAHIDATSRLKHTSYDATGIPVGPRGVIAALEQISRQ